MIAVAVGVEEVGVEDERLFFLGKGVDFLGEGVPGATVEESGVSDAANVDCIVCSECYIRH